MRQEGNEAPILAAVRMNLDDMTPSESQTRKIASYVIPFIGSGPNKQIWRQKVDSWWPGFGSSRGRKE